MIKINNIIVALLGICLGAMLIFLSVTKLVWLAYFFIALFMLFLYILLPKKQGILIAAFFVTIPFNMVKHFGDAILFAQGKFMVWQGGVKSLQYISVNEMVLLMLIIPGIVKLVLNKNAVGLKKEDWFFVIYTLIAILSVCFNPTAWEFGAKNIRVAAVLLLIYLYFARNFDFREHWRFFLYAVLGVLLVESAVGTAQYFGIYSGIFKVFGANIAEVGFMTVDIKRIFGTFSHPNTFSSFLVLILPLVLAGLFIEKNKFKLLFFIASLAGIGVLFLTYSRGAWIAFIIQLLTLLIFGRNILPRWVYNKFLWLLAAMVGLVACVVFYEQLAFRFFSRESTVAAFSRFNQMKVAFYYIIHYPVLGVGFGNYATELTNVDRLVNVSSHGLVVHNIFLKVWAETGILGLFFYLSLYFVAAKKLIAVIKSKCGTRALLALAVLAAIVGHAIHNLVDVAEIQYNISATLFLLFGIALALSRKNIPASKEC